MYTDVLICDESEEVLRVRVFSTRSLKVNADKRKMGFVLGRRKDQCRWGMEGGVVGGIRSLVNASNLRL